VARTMVSSSCVPSGRLEGCLGREEEELSVPAASVSPHDMAEGRQAAVGSSEGWWVAMTPLDVFCKFHQGALNCHITPL